MITASQALVRSNLETLYKPVRVSASTSRPQTVDVVMVVVVISSGCDFASNGSEGRVLVRGLEATVGEDSGKAAVLYPLPLSDLRLPPPRAVILSSEMGLQGLGKPLKLLIYTPLLHPPKMVCFSGKDPFASIRCSKRSFAQERLEVPRLNASSLLSAKACVSTTGSQHSNPLSYFSKLLGVPETLGGRGLGLSLVHLASSWDPISFIHLNSIQLNPQIASD